MNASNDRVIKLRTVSLLPENPRGRTQKTERTRSGEAASSTRVFRCSPLGAVRSLFFAFYPRGFSSKRETARSSLPSHRNILRRHSLQGYEKGMQCPYFKYVMLKGFPQGTSAGLQSVFFVAQLSGTTPSFVPFHSSYSTRRKVALASENFAKTY